jgi:large subunit ribosomal protein L25
MKTIEIKGSLRGEVGKKASKTLRSADNVPCVMYGGEKNINFYAPSLSFKHLVYTPNVYLVKLDIDGTAYDAILKEIQFHPVSDKIIHIDFIQISQDKPDTMDVPVHITGNSIGVKKGGRLRLSKRYVKLKALPKALPDFLLINVEDLDIGQGVKVGDLKYDNIAVLSIAHESVVNILTSRVATKEEMEEDAAKAAKLAGAEKPAEEGAAGAPEKGEKGEKAEQPKK